jgi:dihydrofolate reductase
MRKLIVSEFITLDGVIQAPGAPDEDRDGGFAHGGWTLPYWHDDIGKSFVSVIKDADAFLLGRRTYVTHAAAFEPMPGALKAQPGKDILTDGSSQLVHTLLANDLVDELHLLLYPVSVGGGKRLFVDGTPAKFTLVETVAYPTGVVGLHYKRNRA